MCASGYKQIFGNNELSMRNAQNVTSVKFEGACCYMFMVRMARLQVNIHMPAYMFLSSELSEPIQRN